MKNRLTHNLGMKILSVVVAAIVWLAIMNIADPVVNDKFSNIPVKIINDEVITSRGYQYSIESGDTVDIKVKGKRSIVDKLSESDFTAIADFNSLNSMYMVSISVDCAVENADELTISLKNENMAVKLEDQETQPYSVRIVQTGNVKEGYYVYDTKVSSTLIQVTGSATQMALVKEIVATVDVDGMNSTFTADCELVAYDIYGNEIDYQKISFSQAIVAVTVGICPTKTVDVEAVTVNSPADGYYVEKIEYAPQSLLIAADETILKFIKKLEVPCDINQATDNVELKLDADAYLTEAYGDNCYAVEENTSIAVVVTIKKKAERKISLDEIAVEPRNLGEGLECSTYTLSNSYITILGPEEEINKVNVEDLKLYIDMAGCDAGTYSRRVKTDYAGTLEIKTGDVMVRLTEIPAEASTEDGTDIPTDNPADGN